MTIRTEMHRTPWGPEYYAIIDDLYDPADQHPLAGMGSTRDEAIADLWLRLDDLLCP